MNSFFGNGPDFGVLLGCAGWLMSLQEQEIYTHKY